MLSLHEPSQKFEYDAAIDAGCVVLHALSECEERGWHVYCQLDDGSPAAVLMSMGR